MNGSSILNLGCGSRTSRYCVNIDRSILLRLKSSRVGTALAPVLLQGERLQRFRALEGEIVLHDLRRGIPAPAESADVVYHCHVFEHLERQAVQPFLGEIWRVLKTGGIHRVVVPDFESACRQYVQDIDNCLTDDIRRQEHDDHVGEVIEQLVRREASGTSRQPPLRRWVENRVLGDARRRGETHAWMYDRISLAIALSTAGFRDITVCDYRTSSIPNWEGIGLDIDEQGREYRPGSLYMEAYK